MKDSIYFILKDTISSLNISDNKLWGISNDALASTLITIVIFLLGLTAKYIYDYRKNYKRLKNISYYFKSNIPNILRTATKAIDSLKDINIQLLDKRDSDLFFKDDSTVSFDFFNKISHVDLFEVFLRFSNLKTKEDIINRFNTISNEIKSLEYLIKHGKDTFLKMYEFISQYSTNCNNSMKQIANLINEFKKINLETKRDSNNDFFLREVIGVVLSLNSQINPKDSHYQYEYFIIPLKDLCNKYSQEPRVADLIKPIMEFKYYYESRERTKELMIKAFKNNIELLETIVKDLSDLNLK